MFLSRENDATWVFGGLFNLQVLQVAVVRSLLKKSVAMSDYFGHYFYYKAGVK